MRLFLTGLLVISFNILSAQQGNPSRQDVSGFIKGVVIEKATGEPIEYANITVHSAADSSLVSGGISDSKGNFKVNRVGAGEYFANIQFIGFGESTVTDIRITPRNSTVDLGVIEMEISAQMLGEINVDAQVERVEYRLDRRVVNISEDISATGGSAVDALENVPGVQTDLDDNVSIRGTESFLVLIDGRPSPLGGSEALQQIPADAIESIEIITNPSARYDPEGVGGIINVIMKKDRRAGYNAQVSASYGSFNSFGGDFLVNIRKENFNFFVGGNYNDRINRGVGTDISNRYLPGDTTFTVNNENERYRVGNSGSARFGADYYLNDNDVITVSGIFNTYLWGRGMESQAETFYQYDNDRFDYYNYLTDNEFSSQWQSFSGDINYFKKFEEYDSELQAYFSYSTNYRDQRNHFTETETDKDFNVIDENDISETKTTDGGDGSRIQANIDYEHPINNKFRLEAGYQIAITDLSNEYKYQNLIGSEWIDDPDMFNPYVFNQNIQSGYLIFSNALQDTKFGYMLGVRTEYTDREFAHEVLDTSWTYPGEGQNKLDFFPTFHVSYQLPADIQVMGSYSRRLQRPRPWHLNPFEDVTDPNNRRRGNPLLEPQYTNSYELNFQKRFNRNFISLEAYYRESNNRIERQMEVHPDYPDVFISTFQNIGESLATGGELMANVNLNSWWNLNLSGTAYYYEISGVNRSTTTWNTRFNNTFRIFRTNTRIQISGMYHGASITFQGETGAMYMINAAIRQDFLDNQLSINLALRDVFDTMGREMTYATDTFDSFITRSRRGPTFRLSVTYRIRDFQPRRERMPDGGMNGGDDII